MHQRHARSRWHGIARRLPAVVLSGLFMVVSAGLPALASTAQSRELSVETKPSSVGVVTLAAAQELPEAIAAPTTPAPEAGLLPPPAGETTVDPLDLYRLPMWLERDGHLEPRGSQNSAHPDRAPPGNQQ
ncbi:hypothetical protein G1H11_09685 [Phytoactinopolyspora alkaliphila]|uniref:Uncharacterized protein n=1 Tax=Phytoactinopolyspora alkaliphila TaxID=1783498 RepID=A0A6N9YKR5_9ACTN|nr:hypothetical protein [Phytoactinopolyspora alkaliphila]NED95583.1 hypothetical protein [Phytoactinopolyspora alkaliphila]